MNDEDKTKDQLVGEVIELRGRIQELERQLQCQGTARRPRQGTGEQEICLTVLNATEDAVFFMDTQGRIVFVNETLAQWLHVPHESLLGANLFDAIPEPCKTVRKTYVDKAVLTGEVQRFEDEREGRWLEHRVYPIVGPDNTVSHLAVYAIDITKQKLLEVELRQSEAKYRALIEGIPAVTYMADVDTYTSALYVSPQIQAILGLSEEEAKADPEFWHRRLHPDDREFTLAKIGEAQETGAPLVGEYRMVKDDGQVVWVHDEAHVVRDDTGRPLCLQGVMFDITERRRMEDLASAHRDLAMALTEMTQLDHAMALCLDTALDAADMDCGAVYLVEEKSGDLHLVSWRGLSPEFVNAVRFYPPDSPNARLVQRGEPVYKPYGALNMSLDDVRRREGLRGLGIIPIQHQGRVIGCLNVGSHRMDEVPQYARTAFETIGAQMGTAIRRFQAERERLRLTRAVERVADAVVITSLDGTIEYGNHALSSITGYAPDELIGKDIRSFRSGKQDDLFYEELWAKIAGGQTWTGRYQNRKKSGETFECEATISPVIDDRGRIVNYIGIARDITQELKFEERLRQSEKMDAIGNLAGGIAHDFNNILAAIIGFTELSIDDAPEGSLIKRNMTNVLKAGIRGRDLVKLILSFSRKSDVKRAPLRLAPVVEETFKLLRATTPSTVAMELQTHATSDEVLADSTEISQLLMNLGANAAYAMREQGGLLEIALHDIEFNPDSHPPHQDLAPGAYIELSVKDTGCGMDATTKHKIFEPFFTTKERGQGTGLGLAVVHGIVQSLQGAITVSSEPGRGSTFTVFLPKVVHKQKVQAEMVGEIPGGKECILFVDDEEPLVEAAREMLGRLGYEVVATTDSTQALDIFSGEPHRFHLVITDYTMPDMTGVGLTKDLMRIRPDIPIILCTGYTEMISRDEARAMGIREFVMKPLVKREMAETIRRVLDTKILS
jgi:PAS domain S-box-containing protein